MATLIQAVFLGACLVLLGALLVWGILVRRLASAIETRHPEEHEILRQRSRKGGRRLAVTSELQKSLAGGLPLPDAILADPVCAPMIAREGRLRLVMLFSAGAAAAAFMAL
ncbi:hypothetical protein ACQ5SO_06335 [Rhodovulum sp. DZ06]|uniref:hypothetical protein n=1 Tax=Rhodovulum sp. DZ06 TaxID=3425126 RepID=UPI003D34FC52